MNPKYTENKSFCWTPWNMLLRVIFCLNFFIFVLFWVNFPCLFIYNGPGVLFDDVYSKLKLRVKGPLVLPVKFIDSMTNHWSEQSCPRSRPRLLVKGRRHSLRQDEHR